MSIATTTAGSENPIFDQIASRLGINWADHDLVDLTDATQPANEDTQPADPPDDNPASVPVAS